MDEVRIIAAGAQTEVVLVQGSDWADASTGLERATVMGIRGWISVAPIPLTASASSTFWMAIALLHEDSTLPLLNTATAYIEDILWTGGISHRNEGNATVEGDRVHPGFVWEMNVKARRRITDQQQIGLFYLSTSTSTQQFVVSCVMRSLVRRK